jgi:hypothetical protein
LRRSDLAESERGEKTHKPADAEHHRALRAPCSTFAHGVVVCAFCCFSTPAFLQTHINQLTANEQMALTTSLSQHVGRFAREPNSDGEQTFLEAQARSLGSTMADARKKVQAFWQYLKAIK